MADGSRGPNEAMRLVGSVTAALATVKYCPFCKTTVEGVSKFTFRKGRPGVGRGAGLGWGGSVTAKLAAHIRAEHPDKLNKD